MKLDGSTYIICVESQNWGKKKMTCDNQIESEAIKQLRATLWARRALGMKDTSGDNAAIARNILDEELGRYEPTTQFYDIDQDTRDRLLAHARQDAAHALLNTISLLRELKRIFIIWTIIFVAILVKLLGWY